MGGGGKDVDEQHVSSVMKMLTDEKRVVTAKYCSHRLHINPNESKKVLRNVYEAHKIDKSGSLVPVFVVYCQKEEQEEGQENDPIEKLTMKLVQGEEGRNNENSELYALAPHVMEDVASVCFSTDSLCLRQLLNDDPHCLAAIRSSQLKNNCSKSASASLSSQPAVPTQSSQKPVQPKAAPGVEKGNNKAPPPPVSASNKPTVASLFGKQQQKKGDEDEKKKPEQSSKKAVETKASPPEKQPSASKMEVSPKKTKAANREEDEAVAPVVSKKRNRRVVVEDDDEEQEKEKEKDVEPKKAVEQGEKVEEIEEMAVDEKEEKPGNEEKTPASQEHGAGGGARRLVERTYVDDEGYFVTEKTWTHDSSQPSKQAVASTKAAPAPAPAPAAKAAKGASKATNQANKGGKTQTSMTSFFKKV